MGDTEFLIEEQVDRFRFMEERAGDRQRRTSGVGRPLLLDHQGVALDRLVHLGGVVQETTRVLTEASISGKVDHLRAA